MEQWKLKIEGKVSIVEEPDVPIKDADEFAELLDLANKMLVKTCILDNSSSIKGIFGEAKFAESCRINQSKHGNLLFLIPTLSMGQYAKSNCHWIISNDTEAFPSM